MAQPSKGDLHREISDILDGADLSALSSKKVRQKLQEIFDVDLSSRKKEIDQILMALIAKCQSAASTSKRKAEEKEEEKEEEEESRDAPQTSREATERGDAHHSDTSSDELKDASPPAKKKKKKKKEKGSSTTKTKEKTKSKEKSSKKKESKSSKKREAPKSQANVEDSDDEPTINDEELAWKLHQEETTQTRRTRNHSTRKSVPTKTKAASKKQNGTAKDKPKTGYVADMVLSPDLASIIGADKMSRHEVVKRMWGIIKERKLEDPKNKQFHICDDELFKVFGQRRIRTFSMMKYLKGHIKDPRNLTTAV